MQARIREMTADVWLEEIDTRSQRTVETALATLPSMPTEEIAKLQEVDPDISRFLFYWRKGSLPSRIRCKKEPKTVRKLLKSWNRIAEADGIQYRTVLQNGQLILPVSLIGSVLEAVHDKAGHQSAEKTVMHGKKTTWVVRRWSHRSEGH